jgi:hypothetical protein
MLIPVLLTTYKSHHQLADLLEACIPVELHGWFVAAVSPDEGNCYFSVDEKLGLHNRVWQELL